MIAAYILILAMHNTEQPQIGRFYISAGNAMTIVLRKAAEGIKSNGDSLLHSYFIGSGLPTLAWVNIDKCDGIILVPTGTETSSQGLGGVAPLTRHCISRAGIHFNAFGIPVPPPAIIMEIYCYSLAHIDALSTETAPSPTDTIPQKLFAFANKISDASRGGGLSIFLHSPIGLDVRNYDGNAMHGDTSFDFHVTSSGVCEVYTSRQDGGLRCLTQNIYPSKRPKGDNGVSDPISNQLETHPHSPRRHPRPVRRRAARQGTVHRHPRRGGAADGRGRRQGVRQAHDGV